MILKLCAVHHCLHFYCSQFLCGIIVFFRGWQTAPRPYLRILHHDVSTIEDTMLASWRDTYIIPSNSSTYAGCEVNSGECSSIWGICYRECSCIKNLCIIWFVFRIIIRPEALWLVSMILGIFFISFSESVFR